MTWGGMRSCGRGNSGEGAASLFDIVKIEMARLETLSRVRERAG
jgi:hypothetical protein